MLSFLAHHGPALLAGATTVLGLGSLAVAAHRGRPMHRKRLAEWTLAASLVWLCGAWLPLPRWSPDLGGDAAQTGAGLAPADSGTTDVAPLALDRLDPARSTLTAAPPPATLEVPALLAASLPEPNPAGLFVGPPWPLAAVGAAPQRSPPLVDQRPTPAVQTPAGRGAPLGPPAVPGWLERHAAELLAGLFLAGAAVGLGWLLLGSLRLRRVLADSVPAPPALLPLLDELGGQGLELRLLDGRVGPFCVGLRRPVIVLPARLALDGDRRTLAHVLAHEIAHARQGDGLGRLLCALALPAFWCHPLYWWLRRDLRLSAELLADERAARLSGPRHYARDLLSLASTDLATGRAPIGAPSIFGTPSEFTRRIDMLLHRHGPLATHLSRTRQALHGLAAVAVTAGALLCFGASPVSAQDAAHAEADQLRADNAVLQAELANMRSMVQELTMELDMLQQQGEMARNLQESMAQQLAHERHAQARREADLIAADLNETEARLVSIEHEYQRRLDDLNLIENQLVPQPPAAELDLLRSQVDVLSAERRSLELRRDQLQRVIDEHFTQTLAPSGDGGGGVGRPPSSGQQQMVQGYLSSGDGQGTATADGHYRPSHPRYQSNQQGSDQGVAGALYTAVQQGQLGLVSAPEASSSVVLDGALLDLVDRSLQARSELELMATERARLQPLVDQGLASVHDLRGTDVQLRTAEARLQILQTLVRGELGATEIELKRTLEQQPVDQARLMRLEARLDVLSTVL